MLMVLSIRGNAIAQEKVLWRRYKRCAEPSVPKAA